MEGGKQEEQMGRGSEVRAKCSGGPRRRAEVRWSGRKKKGVRRGMSPGGKGRRESKRE